MTGPGGRPHLTGYAMSVYTRAVRMALAVKEVRHDYAEADPFDPVQRARLPHPFGRVPVLRHDRFDLYETQAILDYVEATWPTPTLLPDGTRGRARMRQVMGIAEAYVYRPLVRQVVSQVIFVPLDGGTPDAAQVADGLAQAEITLDELDRIAGEGRVLDGSRLTLADCLLWPMLDYLRRTPQGAALLQARAHLRHWADAMQAHPAARQTDPDLITYATAMKSRKA